MKTWWYYHLTILLMGCPMDSHFFKNWGHFICTWNPDLLFKAAWGCSVSGCLEGRGTGGWPLSPSQCSGAGQRAKTEMATAFFRFFSPGGKAKKRYDSNFPLLFFNKMSSLLTQDSVSQEFWGGVPCSRSATPSGVSEDWRGCWHVWTICSLLFQYPHIIGLTEMFKTPAKMKPQALSLCPNAFSKSEDFLGKKPSEVPNSGEKPLLCTSENFGWFPVLFFSEHLMFSVGIVNGIIIYIFLQQILYRISTIDTPEKTPFADSLLCRV